MIDRTSRDGLALLWRRLAAGRITTGRFADECEYLCLGSEDSAIHNICSVGPDILRIPRLRWSRRLRNRHRLSNEARRKIAIAVLFLRSDREYAWPEEESPSVRGDCLLLVACLLLLVLGMFATIFWQLEQVPGFVAVACFALAVYVFYFSNMRVDRARTRWIEKTRPLGDFEAWPFFRSSDLEEARRNPQLPTG